MDFYNGDVLEFDTNDTFPLIIADPPYNGIVKDKWEHKQEDDAHCAWAIEWTNHLSQFQDTGDVMYVWGGTGKPKNRAFYKYLIALEHETDYRIKNVITWSKRRAYGVKDNYLYTREECLYLIKGTDKPNIFNIPLLQAKRGYAGYNEKYPAKSEYLRRTNVWTDITELFKGKIHTAQKPEALAEVMIAVHTEENDVVLDPFAGSGSTGKAALTLGRDAVLIEKDPDIFATMVERFTIDS